jgi:A/G-specific adenine glycosylase
MKSSTKPPQSAALNRDALRLTEWYRGVRRDLPWRRDRDPYRIWISEIMLQQTTVAAVIPYYERFMARFNSVEALASASVDDVLEHWAGLGYYSRARNLHRSAQTLAKSGFPRSQRELAELPGFGPYTSRAVASLAFGETTGVLDGNVIRVLSRRWGIKSEWWKPKARAELQEIADYLAGAADPADVNQGLMELGATVCTPRSPSCVLCPWVKSCVARAEDRIEDLPLRRPRREREIWQWRPVVHSKGARVLMVKNTYAPFLKGHWILPGSVERLKSAPKSFDYKGTVTHHDIFVAVARGKFRPAADKEARWVSIDGLKKEVPSSLIRKAIFAGGRES